MLYSVFDPQRGLYSYYEGPAHPPINGDLPVPSLPDGIHGIGVPSVDAGRPLPAGAKLVGSGWHAKGIVCGATSAVRLDGLEDMGTASRFAVGALVGLGIWLLFFRKAS